MLIFLRRFVSWLCLLIVVYLIFSTATTFAVMRIFDRASILSVLDNQNVYAKIVPAILDTVKQTPQATDSGIVPLAEPWVTDIANQAFPKEALRVATSTAINGTFDWLEGKTAQPSFVLDFTSNKELLAVKVGEYVRIRSASLPVCTYADIQNLPPNINVFTVTCRPPNISPEQAGQSIAQQIRTDQGFLNNPKIDAQSLNVPGTKDPLFANLDGVRQIYSNRIALLSALLASVIAVSAIGVFASLDRLRALKRLSVAFLTSAVGLAMFAIFTSITTGYAIRNPGGDLLTSTILVPVFSELSRRAVMVYAISAIACLIISIGLFVIHKRLKPKNPQKQA